MISTPPTDHNRALRTNENFVQNCATDTPQFRKVYIIWNPMSCPARQSSNSSVKRRIAEFAGLEIAGLENDGLKLAN